MGRQIIVLTAPSGSGKTSIARRVIEAVPDLRFSVSATTRAKRPGEQEGIDYYFLDELSFRRKIENGAFLEFEEVYPGRFYGTPYAEIERIRAEGHRPLLDIDVKGALNVKRRFADDALTIFIKPPSLETLAERLRNRGTETEETLRQRLERASMEIKHAEAFDAVVINDRLEKAVEETIALVERQPLSRSSH